jgi:hypothetical protein
MPVKYDASSIQILDDPVAFVRRRPEWFVGSDEVRPGFLVTALARGALDLGCKQVEVHHIDDWWAVASDEDWLAYHNQLGVRETFNRILPSPAGVNACRYEVVVRALAASVFTCRAGELVVLSGDEATIRGVLAQEPLCRLREKRVVAFTMGSGHDPAEEPRG